MKRIVLHIGLPKTGTSHIQHWLAMNRMIFADHGIWVPAQKHLPHRWAVEFITDPRRRARPDVRNICETTFAEAEADLLAGVNDPRFDVGILSSEYFFESDVKQVEQLRRYVGAAEIRVIMFLRRQDRLIESAYNQEVKAMGLARELGAPRYFHKRDYLALFIAWAESFGQHSIRVVSYDRATKAGNLLDCFCAAADLPRDLLEKTTTALTQEDNRSLPANLLEFKRLANQAGIPGLEAWLASALEAGLSGPSFRLPAEVARRHLAVYEASNAELARRLGFSDPESLFPTDDLNDDGRGVDLSGRVPVETVAQLLAFLASQFELRTTELNARIAELERATRERTCTPLT